MIYSFAVSLTNFWETARSIVFRKVKSNVLRDTSIAAIASLMNRQTAALVLACYSIRLQRLRKTGLFFLDNA